MRIAPYASKIAILTLGIAIGVATVFATCRTEPKWSSMPARPDLVSAVAKGSSAELGARLLERVGRDLIADNRAKRAGDEPMLLYAVPKPNGETLCRVDVYTVAPKIIRGAVSERERWADDLKIETKYGLWKRPSAIGGDRDKACAAFRDFEHLISEGSVSSAERGVFVMDALLEQAKAGKFRFKVSCIIGPTSPDGMRCDPLKVLRALSLRDLYQTEMKSELRKEKSFVRQDELWVASGKATEALKITKDVVMVIRVEDEQHLGKRSTDEADILSVAVEIFPMD